MSLKATRLLVVALLFDAATASFDSNLNYNSPSRLHPRLGLDIPKIHRRSWKRDNTAWDPSQLSFTHGVAAGDPLADRIVLWTRAAPFNESDASNITVTGDAPLYNHDTEQYVAASKQPVCVEWVVNDGGNAVTSGKTYTSSDIDFTVKIEPTGLKSFTQYTYQFNICGSSTKSPVGRFKTAPAANQDVSNVDLAIFSCSNYPNGYFNAYGNAARKGNQDYVVHLGDYIYESRTGGPRAHKPANILFTLYDYRTRLNQYRTDPDLKALHQNFSWITVWDDHEIANNGVELTAVFQYRSLIESS